MLCTFFTYKRELRGLWYPQKRQNLFKRWENPQSKTVFNGWLVGWITVWGWGKEENLSLTLRKECKCWFLPGDLIPPLLSGTELCRAQSFGNGNQASAGTNLVFSLIWVFLEVGRLAGTTFMEGVLTLAASFLLSFCKLCWDTRGYLNNIYQAFLTLKKTPPKPKTNLKTPGIFKIVKFFH